MFLFGKKKNSITPEQVQQNLEVDALIKDNPPDLKIRLYLLHESIVYKIARRYFFSIGKILEDDINSVAILALLTFIERGIKDSFTQRLVIYVHNRIYNFLMKEFRLCFKSILHKTGLLAGKRNLQENHQIVMIELHEILDKCIKTPMESVVFDLHYAGYSLKEIAEKMKLHYVTIRKCMVRIRKRFRRINDD